MILNKIKNLEKEYSIKVAYQYLLYFLITVAFFANYINRLTHIRIGSLIDILIIITILITIREVGLKEIIKNKLFILISSWLLFLSAQHLAIDSGSSINWISILRNYSLRFFICIPVFYLIKDNKSVINIIIFLLVLCSFASIYSLFQFFIYYPNIDLSFIYSTQEKFELFSSEKFLRSISFFSDPTTFGITLAVLLQTILIMAFLSKSIKLKLLLIPISILLASGIIISFSRTPFILTIIAGITFIVFKPNLRLIGTIILFAFIGYIYITSSNNTFSQRIKSSFNLKNNNSWIERVQDRKFVQKNAIEYPLGLGLGRTGYYGKKYYSGKELSHFESNSGFLKLALETGSIGLSFFFIFLIILFNGLISKFNNLKKTQHRHIYLALLIPLISLTCGNFSQDTLIHSPTNLIFFIFVGLLFRISEIDKSSHKRKVLFN